MADRVRDLAKRSGSKLHISKGSMAHIGSTPYIFKVDIFFSYVDNINNATDVCISWERKGKAQSTSIVKVQNRRATFRQALSMDLTMFRKSSSQDQLKFDEKRVKLLLKKASPDGKTIGKIVFNLSDHINSSTISKLFDLKLSNGSTIVTKLEATLLRMGKKKKLGSALDTDVRSDMTNENSAENDSLFGDDEQFLGDVDLLATSSPLSNTSSDSKSPDHPTVQRKLSMKPDSSDDPVSPAQSMPSPHDASLTKKMTKNYSRDESMLEESVSLKDKLKHKVKDKKGVKKVKEGQSSSGIFSRGSKGPFNADMQAQNVELKSSLESLRKENAKLKTSKQAAMEELEALRADLDTCEAALEEAEESLNARGGAVKTDTGGGKKLQELEHRITELETLNDALLEELEELQEGDPSARSSEPSAREKALKKRVDDLETALRREPQYLEVVNELKIAKVSLALAEMEKEQALFALQSHAPLSSIKNS